MTGLRGETKEISGTKYPNLSTPLKIKLLRFFINNELNPTIDKETFLNWFDWYLDHKFDNLCKEVVKEIKSRME